MRVFELFSGIGGMHYALQASGIEFEVTRALDINPTCNELYRFNFPDTVLLEKNVQSLTAEYFNNLNIEFITLSPPCQPFTRQGLQKDLKDRRSDALSHLINILPNLKTVNYILFENVVGFEKSIAHNEILKCLEDNFTYQEFILSPTQFNIPNSRSRYYLLAKRKSLKFSFNITKNIMYNLPDNNFNEFAFKNNFKIGDIIEITNNKIPDSTLRRYYNIFDIVSKDSKVSCCFTKGYTHYIEGTGSVFCPFDQMKIDEVFRQIDNADMLETLNLRFFTPREVSRLLMFPDCFKFLESMTEKQLYRVLGNSINVHVVAVLIKLLFS